MLTADSVTEIDGRVVATDISDICIGNTEKGDALVGYQIDKNGVKNTVKMKFERLEINID